MTWRRLNLSRRDCRKNIYYKPPALSRHVLDYLENDGPRHFLLLRGLTQNHKMKQHAWCNCPCKTTPSISSCQHYKLHVWSGTRRIGRHCCDPLFWLFDVNCFSQQQSISENLSCLEALAFRVVILFLSFSLEFENRRNIFSFPRFCKLSWQVMHSNAR